MYYSWTKEPQRRNFQSTYPLCSIRFSLLPTRPPKAHCPRQGPFCPRADDRPSKPALNATITIATIVIAIYQHHSAPQKIPSSPMIIITLLIILTFCTIIPFPPLYQSYSSPIPQLSLSWNRLFIMPHNHRTGHSKYLLGSHIPYPLPFSHTHSFLVHFRLSLPLQKGHSFLGTFLHNIRAHTPAFELEIVDRCIH